jgi:hypothetical protein
VRPIRILPVAILLVLALCPDAGAQRAIQPRTRPPVKVPERPGKVPDRPVEAPPTLAPGRADSVRMALVPRASGLVLGHALQAGGTVELPGKVASRPRLCFECGGDSLAVRLEIPLLAPVGALPADRLRFRFETEDKRPFYVEWRPDADPGVFVTGDLAWWRSRLKDEKVLRIAPPGALDVDGSFEFEVGDFERAIARARETCAWRASLSAAGPGPGVTPPVLPPALTRYFPGQMKVRDRDPVVVLLAGIDSTGRVTGVTPYLSLPGFDEKAEKELRQAVIRPAEREGRPIDLRVFVPIRFVR